MVKYTMVNPGNEAICSEVEDDQNVESFTEINTTLYVDGSLEEEDWEKEISESQPYDTEDVIQFERRSLNHLVQRGENVYNPASHHVPPIKWVRLYVHHIRGQFEDAEE